MTTTLILAIIALFVGVGALAFLVGAAVATSARDEEHARELREARARAREHAEGKGE